MRKRLTLTCLIDPQATGQRFSNSETPFAMHRHHIYMPSIHHTIPFLQLLVTSISRKPTAAATTTSFPSFRPRLGCHLGIILLDLFYRLIAVVVNHSFLFEIFDLHRVSQSTISTAVYSPNSSHNPAHSLRPPSGTFVSTLRRSCWRRGCRARLGSQRRCLGFRNIALGRSCLVLHNHRRRTWLVRVRLSG